MIAVDAQLESLRSRLAAIIALDPLRRDKRRREELRLAICERVKQCQHAGGKWPVQTATERLDSTLRACDIAAQRYVELHLERWERTAACFKLENVLASLLRVDKSGEFPREQICSPVLQEACKAYVRMGGSTCPCLLGKSRDVH